jgi:hypothetical protein
VRIWKQPLKLMFPEQVDVFPFSSLIPTDGYELTCEPLQPLGSKLVEWDFVVQLNRETSPRRCNKVALSNSPSLVRACLLPMKISNMLNHGSTPHDVKSIVCKGKPHAMAYNRSAL